MTSEQNKAVLEQLFDVRLQDALKASSPDGLPTNMKSTGGLRTNNMKRKKLDAVDMLNEHLANEPFLLVGVDPGEEEADNFDPLSLLNDDEEFNIFFSDLTPEAQARYLRWRETSKEDENFEISPLVILCKEESET